MVETTLATSWTGATSETVRHPKERLCWPTSPTSPPLPTRSTTSSPPDTVAGTFYPGGTTGHPQDVILITAALGALATGEIMVPGGTALHAAPMFHLAGIWPRVSGMLIGSRHFVLPAFDPKALVVAIRDNDVTHVLLVPIVIQHMVATLGPDQRQLPSLRHLTYGGSPLSDTLLTGTAAALPDVGLVQAYGMSELSPVATMLRAVDHVATLRRPRGPAVTGAHRRPQRPPHCDGRGR